MAGKSKSIFLFKEKLASQAKSWFNRKSRTGGELNNCRACYVSEFHNIIKSPSDFPYTPIHSEENIRTDLKKHENTADWKLFLGQIKYWREIAEKYRYSNKSEFEHISNVIKTIWEEFKKKNYSFSDDELLEIWKPYRKRAEQDFAIKMWWWQATRHSKAIKKVKHVLFPILCL